MAYFIVQSAANMEGRYTQHPSSEAGRSHITLYHLLTHTQSPAVKLSDKAVLCGGNRQLENAVVIMQRRLTLQSLHLWLTTSHHFCYNGDRLSGALHYVTDIAAACWRCWNDHNSVS